MIDVKVTGIEDLRRDLAGFSERRLNAAIATGLTRTAVKVRDGVRAQLPSILDRPTPYTTRQLLYVPASASKLAAGVGFNIIGVSAQIGGPVTYKSLAPGETPADRYLSPNIDGGQRGTKRLEVALRAAGALPQGWLIVPGAGARIDAYGNWSRGQIIQVLSQLRIRLVAGSERNMSRDATKAIRAQRKAGGRFFVIKPGSKGAAPGIYQREFTGNNVTPVAVFVRQATYRKRFDFDGIAARLTEQHLQPEIDRAIGESAARMTGGSR